MQYIQSTQNKTYKLIKSLKLKKSRSEQQLFCVEGIKGCLDAIDHGAETKITAVKKSLYDELADKLSPVIDSCYIVDDSIFDPLCDTKNPEGIICVIKMQKSSFEDIQNGLYIYLDCLADPGNCGTIIRTLDACGGRGVILSVGCTDLYNPKTIRASMGSFFAVNTYTEADYDKLNSLKQKGFKIICAALNDSASDFKECAFPENAVIVIGNEANGISPECLALADETAVIPILGKAESLNASVAAAILMYEWQRRNRP